MVKVIVSTMYGSSPVVFAVTKFGADKLILFVNKDADDVQKEAADALKKAFGDILEMKMIKVEPYDVVGIASEAVKVFDSFKDQDEIIVNISGARKPMALGLLYAAYARSRRISKVVYCSEEKQVFQLPKLSFNLNPSQLKVLEMVGTGKYESITELAKKVDISRAMLYRNIKELQDLGLVEDGLKLTDAGRIARL